MKIINGVLRITKNIRPDTFNEFSKIKKIKIDTKDIIISTNAFKNNNNIESVIIRKTAYISRYAFENCTNLKYVCMPVKDKVIISDYAFKNCSNLKNVYNHQNICGNYYEIFNGTKIIKY